MPSSFGGEIGTDRGVRCTPACHPVEVMRPIVSRVYTRALFDLMGYEQEKRQ